MTNKIIIYDLSCPITGNIRYVGKTSRKINERLAQHISDVSRKNNHVQCWIKSLLNNNLKPIITILDEVDVNDWVFWEKHYISLFKTFNFNLCNHTEGGEQPSNMNSLSAKAKRAETIKTSKAWKEGKVKQAAKLKSLHKEGKIKFGFAHLNEIERKEIGNKIKENNPRKRTIKIEQLDNQAILNFYSIKEMAKYFNCNIGTVRDFIYSKRASKVFKNYFLLENKNKYDRK
jgi:hypothetical protein